MQSLRQTSYRFVWVINKKLTHSDTLFVQWEKSFSTSVRFGKWNQSACEWDGITLLCLSLVSIWEKREREEEIPKVHNNNKELETNDDGEIDRSIRKSKIVWKIWQKDTAMKWCRFLRNKNEDLFENTAEHEGRECWTIDYWYLTNAMPMKQAEMSRFHTTEKSDECMRVKSNRRTNRK